MLCLDFVCIAGLRMWSIIRTWLMVDRAVVMVVLTKMMMMVEVKVFEFVESKMPIKGNDCMNDVGG